MVWLARLSLANRAIIGLVTVLVVVFGVISTTSLRQELFPSLDVPVATVVTAYPGASPEVVEQQVTTPIEAAVGGITGVTGTHSISTGGSSVITLDLEYGSNLAELTSQFQRTVQGLTLPAGVSPKVVTASTDSLPVVLLAVSSNLGDDRVAAVLRDQVRPLLSGLDGVADVTLSGIRDPQITIDVDTKKATSHGVSLNSVVSLLQANGVRLPAGQLTSDANPLTVEVGSPITSVDALNNLYLTSVPAVPSLTGRIGGASSAAPAGRPQPAVVLEPIPSPPMAVIPVSWTAPASHDSVRLRLAASPSPSPGVSPSPTVRPSPTPRARPTPKPPAGGIGIPGITLPRGGRLPTIPPLGGVQLPNTAIPSLGGVRLPSTAIPAIPPATGPPVRLGDIATITAAPVPATGYARTSGVASIGIGVTKKTQANTVAVAEEIRAALPRITELLGGPEHHAAVTVVLDQAPFIRQSVEDLTTEGLLGLVFAVLVILGFLLSVRATLVTAVSIPLSVLVAMIVLDLGGYTLNILTLGALTVAIGRVVDDSIVVIENIKRHIGYGGPRGVAILTVVREVAGAVTASTVTTVAVFAPIGLVGGQVGELFRPFAVTVTAALLASLLVSLTVVPALSSVVLRRRVVPIPEREGPARDGAAPRRSRLQRGYLPVLRGAVRRPVVSLLVAVGILAGTLALVPRLHTNFLGDPGGTTLAISQELASGTALPQADAAAKRVEGVLGATPGVASYQVTVGNPDSASFGFAPPGQGLSVNRFSVTLRAKINATSVADELRHRFTALGGSDQVGRLTVQGGRGGFGNQVLLVSVRAVDRDALARAAGAVEQALASIPGASDVRNNLAAAQPTVAVTVDRQKAAKEGLTEVQVGQAVATALRGAAAGTVTISGVQQRVLVRAGTAPGDLAALRALPLAGVRGTIPLSDVATVTQSSTAPSISHTDGSRSAEVTARPAADDLGAVSTALAGKLAAVALPAGATAQIGGVSTQQNDAFRQLGLAMLVAIAVVYLVMVLTFRSLLQPLLLLVAIPFAATGALGLLLLTGTPLGVPALIGMLMLIGIVVTNAIVLIDLVNQYRRDGRELLDAVIEGAAQRLRPILMTAVATVFALAPMALGLTGGGVFISQPLAIVVIGGLVSSTLLTLVLVPVLYVLTSRAHTDEAPTLTLPAVQIPSAREPQQDRELAAGPGVLLAPSAEEPASLSGEVRSASGTGVAALVALLNSRGEVVAGTRADVAGGYRFSHVPPGDHVLLVSPPAGEPATQPVALPSSGSVRRDVSLPPTGDEARTSYRGQHRSEP